VTSDEIIAALREESSVGLKLYLEHLIFERSDSVTALAAALIVEDLSASRTSSPLR
jgi:hypothetical protein